MENIDISFAPDTSSDGEKRIADIENYLALLCTRLRFCLENIAEEQAAKQDESKDTELILSALSDGVGEFTNSDKNCEIFNDYSENVAQSYFSHAEGSKTSATAPYSHTEGYNTVARELASHAEGIDSIASGQASHAEGEGCEAGGRGSHAGGYHTKAYDTGMCSVGRCNKTVYNALFVVGNGYSNGDKEYPSDALVVDDAGNLHIAGRFTADGGVADLSEYLRSNEIADWAKSDSKPKYTAAEVGAAAESHAHAVSDITDMPDWAKSAVKPEYTASEVGAAAEIHTHTVSDIPDMPDWAKADSKPRYTAAEVGAATSNDITAAINAAEIGGTQILKGTNTVTVLGSQSYKSPWENGGWRAASGGTGTRGSIAITDAPEANIKLGWELTQSAGALDICQDDIPIASGQTYTASCYARGTGRLRINCGKSPYRAKYFDFDNVSEWTKCTNTFVASEATTGSASELNAYFGNVSAGTLQICGMKLETGSKATGWNEAPISVEARLSDLEERVTALETAILSGGEG